MFMRVINQNWMKSLGLVLLVLATWKCVAVSPAQDSDGKLVAIITWGDVDNTPAKEVYVEAHGYVERLRAEKSFVFKMANAGHDEVLLPPGVYDVFVSDDISAQVQTYACKSGQCEHLDPKVGIG